MEENRDGVNNQRKRIPKVKGPGEGGYLTECPICLVQDDDCRFSFEDIFRHREWCEAWLNAKIQAGKHLNRDRKAR